MHGRSLEEELGYFLKWKRAFATMKDGFVADMSSWLRTTFVIDVEAFKTFIIINILENFSLCMSQKLDLLTQTFEKITFNWENRLNFWLKDAKKGFVLFFRLILNTWDVVE